MNLSIFNFNKSFLIFLIVLIFLGTCEVVIRKYDTLLSKDVNHIKDIPNVIEELCNSNQSRILFLGNSLTRCGIVSEVVKTQYFRSFRKAVNIYKIYPDDTTVLEWYYLLDSLLKKCNSCPDIVIIPFSNNQLRDPVIAFENIQRLSQFTDYQNMFEVIEFANFSFGQIVDYSLCKFSVFYRNKNRIQKRILDLVPSYRETARRINVGLNEASDKKIDPQLWNTYRSLNAIISIAKSKNLKIIFVSVPLPEEYIIDRHILQIIMQAKMEFIDCRTVPGITSNHYLDGMHLNQDGAYLFTSCLSKYLIHKNILSAR